MRMFDDRMSSLQESLHSWRHRMGYGRGGRNVRSFGAAVCFMPSKIALGNLGTTVTGSVVSPEFSLDDTERRQE